ncbi:hypothetical protein LMIY3S_00115 [Labrys miyagiensis]
MTMFFADAVEKYRLTVLPIDFCRLCLLGLLLLVSPAGADAHGSGTANIDGSRARGLEIRAITHSDMEFVSPYYRAIIALAEKQTSTDETLRRLLNYTKVQNTYCLWGLVPGAITDEESSLNLCSHAYLAGSWALLQHLRARPDARAPAAEIIAAIEKDRSASPMLILCQSSAETFHTGEFIVPLRPTVAAGWLLSLAVMGGLAIVFASPVITQARRRIRF